MAESMQIEWRDHKRETRGEGRRRKRGTVGKEREPMKGLYVGRRAERRRREVEEMENN